MSTQPLPDSCRGWMLEISRLRARAAKSHRGGAIPQDELLESALVLCESLLRDLAGARLECETVRQRHRTEAAHQDDLLQRCPVAWVETDARGVILGANQPAASVLNMSTRYLKNRLLLHFAEDRAAFARLLGDLSEPQSATRHIAFSIRPRERAPLMLDAAIMPASATDSTSWFWFLVPASDGQRLPTELAG